MGNYQRLLNPGSTKAVPPLAVRLDGRSFRCGTCGYYTHKAEILDVMISLSPSCPGCGRPVHEDEVTEPDLITTTKPWADNRYA